MEQKIEINNCYNIDCKIGMELMLAQGMKADWIITDPPSQLWYTILNYYTKEGDLILDPFAGSQSLRIACHKLNRKYIGFELNKEYYDKGCEWFKRETAQISLFE